MSGNKNSYGYERYGLEIKEGRKNKEMSQAGLSKITGIAAKTIGRVENATQKPSSEVMVELAVTLNVSLDEIFLPNRGNIVSSKRRQAYAILEELDDDYLWALAKSVKELIGLIVGKEETNNQNRNQSIVEGLQVEEK